MPEQTHLSRRTHSSAATCRALAHLYQTSNRETSAHRLRLRLVQAVVADGAEAFSATDHNLSVVESKVAGILDTDAAGDAPAISSEHALAQWAQTSSELRAYLTHRLLLRFEQLEHQPVAVYVLGDDNTIELGGFPSMYDDADAASPSRFNLLFCNFAQFQPTAGAGEPGERDHFNALIRQMDHDALSEVWSRLIPPEFTLHDCVLEDEVYRSIFA